ncbi:MAG: carboxypeptidase regulatory-like domain-containing protein [Lachnospiraceae bacterium]|nr:carboxypeptidase regulatory-like domain-containing protein [Lachnospiraceae bacterium]
MKKRKGLLKKAIAGVMALALCASGMSTSLAAPAGYEDYTNDPGVYTYSSSDPLYAATHFHIFAENSASIAVHCNGNIAANVFTAGANSGSNVEYGDEITYIRTLNEGSRNFGKNTTIVFGAETNVYSKNSGAEMYITLGDKTGEHKIEPADGVYVETSTLARYIDLEAEFDKLSKLSVNLAKEATDAEVTYSENVAKLASSTTDTYFLNLSTSDFMNRAFVVENCDFTTGQALVINVDLGQLTNYTLPFTQVLFKDTSGNSFGTGEDKGAYTGMGNVLWNFYGRDTSGNVIPYTGTITTSNEFKGTVFAPEASIKTPSSNQDGNFIGYNVDLGGGETHRWDFGGELPDYSEVGSLQVVVKDADTSAFIQGVEIQVYDNVSGNPIASLVTDSNGVTEVIGDLPVGNTYKAVITQVPSGYDVPTGGDDVKISTAIVKNDTTQVIFELTQDVTETPPTETGVIKVTVVEEGTGKLIQGATVTVTDANGDPVDTLTTDAFGTDRTSEIPIDASDATKNNYKLTLTIPTGYVIGTGEAVEKTVVLTKDNVAETFVIKKEAVVNDGSVQIVVVSIEDGVERSIEGAIVKIADNDSHIIKEVTVVTDKTGKTEIVGNLAIGDTYSTEIIGIPEGFEYSSVEGVTPDSLVEGKGTLNITNAKPDIVKYILVQEKGSLVTKVVDDSNNVVPGVTVEVYKENGDTDTYVGTYTTNSNGLTSEIYNLPVGNEYIAKITSVPDGYVMPTDASKISGTKKITDPAMFQIDLAIEKEPTGDLIVTITDKETGDPIKDAVVVVTNSDGEEVARVTTNETGKFTVEDLEPGEYTITTESIPSTYDPSKKPNPETATVIANTTVQKDLTVPGETTASTTGKLEVTVKDKDTDKVIPGAKVDIIDKTTGDVIADDVETDENGFISVDNLPGGDYIIDVTEVPGGYNPPDDKTTTVVTGQTTKEELVVDITPGSMEVVIVDKNDPTKPIPNATVEILNPDGTVKETVQTNGEGKTPVIENLEVGKTYTVHVKDVPGDYEAPDDKKVPIETPKKVEVKLEVGLETTTTPTPETGKMQVVITDKNDPTKPIPGATVVIKNPDGSVVKTVVTDENGLTPVIDKLTVGTTYTIETTDVPDGYSTPTPTTQKITGTELVKVPLVVGRDSGVTSAVGSLYVIITDKNTGKPIPGATVEVSNSAGEKIKTVVTDDTGAFTVTDLKPDTYTVKTTKVPAGYTAPDPQSAAVKSNARTDVHLYVAKGTTTTDTTTDTVVRTGDDSNVQVASILALMACIGIVVVSIMRKREEI